MKGGHRFIKQVIGRTLRPALSGRFGTALARFYNLKLQPAVRTFKPLFGATVMAGVTYRCQCRCAHCGTQTYADAGKPELTEAELIGLARQAAALGAGGLYLFGGEPLLFPGLTRLVEAASGLGLVCTIDTNGLLLDAAKAAELKAAGLDRAGVSLDSADEAEHDRLRGCPGAYRAAVAALKYCRDAGIDVCVSTYATRESLKDGGLDRVIALARTLGVRTRVMSPLRAGRWSGRDDVPFGEDEIEQLRSRLGPDVYWESIFTAAPGAPFHCGCSARTHFYVSPYGEVQPCCYIPVSCGDIKQEPLDRIVRRMWGASFLSGLGGAGDCPMNSESFRERIGGALNGPGPVAAGKLSSPNDRAEWDDWAPEYGRDVDWVEEIHNPDVRELAAPDGRRVLDIGCGTGRRARAVFGGAAKLTAVDFSAGMAAEARRNLGEMPQAEVLQLDIEKEGLPPGRQFDVAVAVSTMHHIGDVAAVLGRVRESLTPGGTLLIIDALSGNPPLTAARYYLEMLRMHSPLRLAAAFFRAFFTDSRVARHKAREIHLSLDDFRRRYADILPGASVEVRHGIFGYLVWKKPGA